ncbi:hypothetical protein [Bacteroides sp. 519]|uniref:hypothetical protein n=1 Tax=Bacteroides sp. 519 TaxID=2302937 RepID=UPI0013D601E4|nr:hypothetical protein [Bacteroides sp. 519]NDV57974.1 hypothetical protein [Bacteroides sp. 519]
MNVNQFLSIINLTLRKHKPLIPQKLNYTICGDQRLTELWFKSKGCRNSANGSCTFCDYWHSTNHNSNEIAQFLDEAFKSLKYEPEVLLVNTSGSILDTWQVPVEAQKILINNLSRYVKTHIILETHLDTLSEDIISLYKSRLNNNLSIEVGVESSNNWVLKYSLNKSFEKNAIEKKITLLKNNNIEPIANILVGAPLLSLPDMINDTIDSIEWAFDIGFESCVIFPINIKKWTLTNWMYENKLYKQPSLWAFIEVLNKIPSHFLEMIEIAWYKEREYYNPAYTDIDISPTTCPKCYSEVIYLLNQYKSDYSLRTMVLDELNMIKCDCKNEFYDELNQNYKKEIDLLDTYKFIAENILGYEWWCINKESISKDVESYYRERSSL